MHGNIWGNTFLPENKEENLKLSKKQQELSVEFQIKASEIMNQYIKPEQRSFTIIAYPIPEIGDNFEEIFKEVVKVNTLDKDKYRQIQQHLIDALDQAVEVHVKGKGKNKTDLYVAMHEMDDPSKETNFENCLADVNIPVGEVFTSPKLTGTNGVLHVGEVYLNDLKFIDLEITFKDGMISEYTCKNFKTEEENKAFIKENLLYNRDTLPMGEFAIGTNTTAYVMAKTYDILYQLPILIVEKMGPHLQWEILATVIVKKLKFTIQTAKKSLQNIMNAPKKASISSVTQILRFHMKNWILFVRSPLAEMRFY